MLTRELYPGQQIRNPGPCPHGPAVAGELGLGFTLTDRGPSPRSKKAVLPRRCQLALVIAVRLRANVDHDRPGGPLAVELVGLDPIEAAAAVGQQPLDAERSVAWHHAWTSSSSAFQGDRSYPARPL